MASKSSVRLFVGLVFLSSALAAAVDPKEGQKCSTETLVPILQNISAELAELRELKKTLETIAPILLSLSPVLNNISSELQHDRRSKTPKSDRAHLVRQGALKVSDDPKETVSNAGDCPFPNEAEFATSPQYVDTKLVTSLTDVLDSVKFSKSGVSKDCAQIECSKACAASESCHAFNFLESGATYVCELVPDNLCLNKSKLAFINWPGGNVWEKKPSSESPSCLDAKIGAGSEISCEVLRPGCLGTWPNCHSCVRNCKECTKRYLPFFSSGECTFWPDDYAPLSTPIFGYCSSTFTYLANRKVNLTTGEVTRNYLMSFKDMHRLSQLKTHSKIMFWFDGPNNEAHWYTYENWAIDENGTLSSLTFESVSEGEGDIFNLNGTALKPTPFVRVESDLLGCGSFWLLNPKGAEYCPGGAVSMFGEIESDGFNVLPGIASPQSRKDKKILKGASILLTNF